MGKYIFKAIGHYLFLGLLLLFAVVLMVSIGKFVQHHIGFEVVIRWVIYIFLGVAALFWFAIEVWKKAEELAKEDKKPKQGTLKKEH